MKRNLKKLFLSALVLLAGASSASAQTEKFYLGVTGYDPTTDAPVTVGATVYDDYRFIVSLPKTDADNLGAHKATVDIRMTNVASLGVKGTRSISKTIETGVTGVNVKLSEFLQKTYGFSGATVPVTIIDGSTTNSFTYNIANISDDYQIVGIPSPTEDARTAWQAITKNVSSTTSSDEDSQINIKEGTYISYGNEILEFNNDVDLLKGNFSMDDLFNSVEKNVTVGSNGLTGDATYQASIFLPAGTVLHVGSSLATLDKDATIAVDFSALKGTTSLNGQISNVVNTLDNLGGTEKSKTAILLFVRLFDAIVGEVATAGNVPVTVTFNDAPKFYLGIRGGNVTSKADDTEKVAGAKIDATVDADYNFVIGFHPDGNGEYNVGADQATVEMRMTDVASLGVSGTRSAKRTVDTGISGVTADLKVFLQNSFAFSKATIDVDVYDDYKNTVSDPVTYSILGNNSTNGLGYNTEITGTTDDTEATREAWHMITDNVEAGTQGSDDSYITFKQGTYVRLGDEALYFDQDVNVLKGSWTVDGTIKDIQDATHVETYTIGEDMTVAETYEPIIYLPAGSTLAVGSSYATLTNDATINVDARRANTSKTALTGLVSGLRDAVNKGTYSGVYYMVNLFDQVVGLVGKAKRAEVEVHFNKAYLLGDVNKDDKLDLTDVSEMTKIILDQTTTSYPLVTSNGKTRNLANMTDNGAYTEGDKLASIADLSKLVDAIKTGKKTYVTFDE